MPNSCVIVGCKNRESVNNKLYSVPKIRLREGEATAKKTKRRLLLWIKAINHKNITANTIKPHYRVCWEHFISGRPAYYENDTDPDWVPSLKLGHSRYTSVPTPQDFSQGSSVACTSSKSRKFFGGNDPEKFKANLGKKRKRFHANIALVKAKKQKWNSVREKVKKQQEQKAQNKAMDLQKPHKVSLLKSRLPATNGSSTNNALESIAGVSTNLASFNWANSEVLPVTLLKNVSAEIAGDDPGGNKVGIQPVYEFGPPAFDKSVIGSTAAFGPPVLIKEEPTEQDSMDIMDGDNIKEESYEEDSMDDINVEFDVDQSPLDCAPVFQSACNDVPQPSGVSRDKIPTRNCSQQLKRKHQEKGHRKMKVGQKKAERKRAFTVGTVKKDFHRRDSTVKTVKKEHTRGSELRNCEICEDQCFLTNNKSLPQIPICKRCKKAYIYQNSKKPSQIIRRRGCRYADGNCRLHYTIPINTKCTSCFMKKFAEILGTNSSEELPKKKESVSKNTVQMLLKKKKEMSTAADVKKEYAALVAPQSGLKKTSRRKQNLNKLILESDSEDNNSVSVTKSDPLRDKVLKSSLGKRQPLVLLEKLNEQTLKKYGVELPKKRKLTKSQIPIVNLVSKLEFPMNFPKAACASQNLILSALKSQMVTSSQATASASLSQTAATPGSPAEQKTPRGLEKFKQMIKTPTNSRIPSVAETQPKELSQFSINLPQATSASQNLMHSSLTNKINQVSESQECSRNNITVDIQQSASGQTKDSQSGITTSMELHVTEQSELTQVQIKPGSSEPAGQPTDQSCTEKKEVVIKVYLLQCNHVCSVCTDETSKQWLRENRTFLKKTADKGCNSQHSQPASFLKKPQQVGLNLKPCSKSPKHIPSQHVATTMSLKDILNRPVPSFSQGLYRFEPPTSSVSSSTLSSSVPSSTRETRSVTSSSIGVKRSVPSSVPLSSTETSRSVPASVLLSSTAAARSVPSFLSSSSTSIDKSVPFSSISRSVLSSSTGNILKHQPDQSNQPEESLGSISVSNAQSLVVQCDISQMATTLIAQDPTVKQPVLHHAMTGFSHQKNNSIAALNKYLYTQLQPVIQNLETVGLFSNEKLLKDESTAETATALQRNRVVQNEQLISSPLLVKNWQAAQLNSLSEPLQFMVLKRKGDCEFESTIMAPDENATHRESPAVPVVQVTTPEFPSANSAETTAQEDMQTEPTESLNTTKNDSDSIAVVKQEPALPVVQVTTPELLSAMGAETTAQENIQTEPVGSSKSTNNGLDSIAVVKQEPALPIVQVTTLELLSAMGTETTGVEDLQTVLAKCSNSTGNDSDFIAVVKQEPAQEDRIPPELPSAIGTETTAQEDIIPPELPSAIGTETTGEEDIQTVLAKCSNSTGNGLDSIAVVKQEPALPIVQVTTPELPSVMGTETTAHEDIITPELPLPIGTETTAHEDISTPELPLPIGTETTAQEDIITPELPSAIGTETTDQEDIITPELPSAIGTETTVQEDIITPELPSAIGTETTAHEDIITPELPSAIGTETTDQEDIITPELPSANGTGSTAKEDMPTEPARSSNSTNNGLDSIAVEKQEPA